jgi:hypothetical protein
MLNVQVLEDGRFFFPFCFSFGADIQCVLVLFFSFFLVI